MKHWSWLYSGHEYVKKTNKTIILLATVKPETRYRTDLFLI